jgi:23S rRNA (adenine2503-C2)-methyltransferase
MVEQIIKNNNLPLYKIDQFNKAFYGDLVVSFDDITTWSKKDRLLLTEIPFISLDVQTQQISKKQDTIKVLFKRKLDGKLIETVLMRFEDGRNTVCVSCMVGCPVNCTFCATGKLGFNGNLTATEIVDQVLYFARILKKEKAKITNVVYMGMGEPMLNLENVQQSIDILTDSNRFGLGARRITVSTSGYVAQFNKLVADGFRGRVAISLHAPNQTLRAKLMPVAKAYSLNQIMEALDNYVELTNKRVSYEYILINEVNDSEENAKELSELLRGRLAHVNLIPYNSIKGVEYERSTPERIKVFCEILKQNGVNYSLRITMGDDIAAACGQLAGGQVE